MNDQGVIKLPAAARQLLGELSAATGMDEGTIFRELLGRMIGREVELEQIEADKQRLEEAIERGKAEVERLQKRYAELREQYVSLRSMNAAVEILVDGRRRRETAAKENVRN